MVQYAWQRVHWRAKLQLCKWRALAHEVPFVPMARTNGASRICASGHRLCKWSCVHALTSRLCEPVPNRPQASTGLPPKGWGPLAEAQQNLLSRAASVLTVPSAFAAPSRRGSIHVCVRVSAKELWDFVDQLHECTEVVAALILTCVGKRDFKGKARTGEK